MGFTMTPEPIKTGVYVHKYYGHLVVVTSTFWFIECDVLYKPRQRKPRTLSQFTFKQDFEYLGEL